MRPESELPLHGTYARYGKAGGSCRCEACVIANSAYMKDWRIRTGRTKGVHVNPAGMPALVIELGVMAA